MALDTQVNSINDPLFQVVSNLNKHIFRAYDIRGLIDTELTSDVFYTIGRSLAILMHEKAQTTCLIGFDARLTSESYASALGAGLLDSGIDVISVGQVPSPVLYFAFEHLQVTSGVMITGSHNPKEYNGVKIVIDGKNLTEADIEAVYQNASAQTFIDGRGAYRQSTGVVDAYIAKISQQITLSRQLKVAIDCGNGVAGAFAGQLFKAIGAEVLELYCEVDGRFPNHHPDPAIEANVADLIQLVKDEKCDLGLAFDGDADRLGLITNTGKIIWPDRQLMLLAQDILKRKPGAVIVYDVKCSSLLRAVIEAAGGQALMCPTGHSIVKKVMRENGAQLAGEMSGHIFIKDNWSGFDDALYSAARLMEILSNSPLDVDQQFAVLPDSVNTPELKIRVEEAEKFSLMAQIINTWRFDNGENILIDGLRYETERAWGLIRASNTSPYLVTRFEGKTLADMEYVQQLFRTKLLDMAPHLTLPF